MLISFLFLNENICCGYASEAPRCGASNEYPQQMLRGTSNEYPQHMFLSRNKKNIMWILPLICSYGVTDSLVIYNHVLILPYPRPHPVDVNLNF